MRGKRNRESSPLSLFSLQDIITCLTGIMILIVLLLAVEAMNPSGESGAPAHVSKPTNPTLEPPDLERMREDLLARMRELEGSVVPPEDAVALVKSLRKMRDDTLADQAVTARQQGEVTALEKAATELRTELSRLESARNAAAENLQKLKDRLLAGTMRRVIIIPGEQNPKTAHLVEAHGTGFRIISLGVPMRNGSFRLSETETMVKQLLGNANPEKEYIVVMIKPSGVVHGMELVEALQQTPFQVGYDALEEDMELAEVSLP